MRSEPFDDIYFSAQDGLAESRHVFLNGCGLPDGWQGRPTFAILELGFGTGLNFLATLQAWRQAAQAGQQLRFTSIEKYPLRWDQIKSALAVWPELATELKALGEQYPAIPAGITKLPIAPEVTLEFCCGNVLDILPHLTGPYDALFLDGFAPAKNPDMWGEPVMAQLACISRPGTRIATFTVARAVRDGLANAGFTVAKQPGFGRKRDMLAGRFA